MQFNNIPILGLVTFSLVVVTSGTDIRGYDSADCDSRPLSTCPNWPQHMCCGFNNPQWWAPRIKSVGIEPLTECSLANWFSANIWDASVKCHAVKDTVWGTGNICMKNGAVLFDGGANWFNLVTLGKQITSCPIDQTVIAMKDITNSFGVSLGSRGLDEDTMILTREEKAAVMQEIYERDPSLKCRAQGYATLTAATDDGGMWVLQGNQNNHIKYETVVNGDPAISHADAIKAAGGTFFENWETNEAALSLLGNGPSNRTLSDRIADGEFESNDYINSLATKESELRKRGQPVEIASLVMAIGDVENSNSANKLPRTTGGNDTSAAAKPVASTPSETDISLDTNKADSFPWIEIRSSNTEETSDDSGDSFPWIVARDDHGEHPSGTYPAATYPSDYPFPEAIEAAAKIAAAAASSSKRDVDTSDATDSFPWITADQDSDEY